MFSFYQRLKYRIGNWKEWPGREFGAWVEVVLWQDAGMPWLLLMGSMRLVTAHVWSLGKVFTLCMNGGDHYLYREYGQLTIACVKWICNMLRQINSTLCQKVLMTQKPTFMLDVYLPCIQPAPLLPSWRGTLGFRSRSHVIQRSGTQITSWNHATFPSDIPK